jgi:hypothetical protein
MFKKLAFLASIVALTVGCHKQPATSSGPIVAKTPEVAAKPEPPKFEVVKPKKAAPPFNLEATDGWSLVNYVDLPADAKEPQLMAIFENDLDEETSVRAAVIAANLTPEEAASFLDDVRAEANGRDNAKVLKERIVRLDGTRAYELIEVRMTSSGVQMFVTLAVTSGKLGFVISCGGAAEDGERILPICAEFVEGFRVRK